MPKKSAAEKKSSKKKPTKKKSAKSFEETLWESANRLRGSVEPAEYKHVVLSLIFLKFASDKFEERKAELEDEGKQRFLDMVEFYAMKNVFYLPPESRWSTILKHAKQADLAVRIDTALHAIEKKNKSLVGALPDNYFSRLELDRSKLAALVDTISQINTIADKSQDIVGRVYEYFLGKFALAEGKGKGEFYTPKVIVDLMARLIEPYSGKIYDPCCGSGGMFVQSLEFVERHQGNTKDVSVYGQEGTATTLKLAKMNLAVRGISANLGARADDTFASDQHPNLKADFILANPPFNLKEWRADDELTEDARWAGYELPPTSNANYAWILHMVSKLSVKGVAGFILANAALSDDGQEQKIRRKLIENDLVEALVLLPRKLFYTTDLSATLWILNRDKSEHELSSGGRTRKMRNRKGEVLFVDLRRRGEPHQKKYVKLTEDALVEAVETFHAWQEVGWKEQYADRAEYCYSASREELAENDFSLVPSKYIEFNHIDEDIDFERDIAELQSRIAEVLRREQRDRDALFEAFSEVGHDVQD